MPDAIRAALTAVSLLLLLTVLGCKNSDLITDAYYATGPGDVDMLWVIDSSASMSDAQVQLVQNFSAFTAALPDPATSTTQMGITTAQAWPCTVEGAPEDCDDATGTAGRVQREDGLGERRVDRTGVHRVEHVHRDRPVPKNALPRWVVQHEGGVPGLVGPGLAGV